MNRSIQALLLAVLISTACTEGREPVAEDAPATPTALPPEAQSALCDAGESVRELAGEAAAEAVDGTGEVASGLEDLRATLEEQASELEAESPAAAEAVRALLDSLTRLEDAVEAADPADIATASADVVEATADLPGCPTPAT